MNNDEIIVDITTEETVAEIKQESKKADKKKNSFHLSVYDLVSIIMSSFIIIAVVFTFAFRLVGVEGSSMTDTFQDGNWLLTVNKESYERGDIVVITEPNFFDEPLIKRVIAKGGETVDIDFSTSTVYVDGVALKEPYTREAYILPKLDDIEFPYTVPEGHLFCMGDNRNGSTDSRSNLIGPLDERYIVGKVLFRFFPLGDWTVE